MNLNNFFTSFKNNDEDKQTVGAGHVKAGALVTVLLAQAMSMSAMANTQESVQAPCIDANQTVLMNDQGAPDTYASQTRLFKDPAILASEPNRVFNSDRVIQPLSDNAQASSLEICEDQEPVVRKLRDEFTQGNSTPEQSSQMNTPNASEKTSTMSDAQERSITLEAPKERNLTIGDAKERSLTLGDAQERSMDISSPRVRSLLEPPTGERNLTWKDKAVEVAATHSLNSKMSM